MLVDWVTEAWVAAQGTMHRPLEFKYPGTIAGHPSANPCPARLAGGKFWLIVINEQEVRPVNVVTVMGSPCSPRSRD